MRFPEFVRPSLGRRWKLHIKPATWNLVKPIVRRIATRPLKTDNHPGGGSDRRRKAIISQRLGTEDIFDEMQERLRTRLRLIVDDLEERLATIRVGRLQAVQGTLDMLRDENVILESESDPTFRKRVEDQLRRTKAAMQTTVQAAGL